MKSIHTKIREESKYCFGCFNLGKYHTDFLIFFCSGERSTKPWSSKYQIFNSLLVFNNYGSSSVRTAGNKEESTKESSIAGLSKTGEGAGANRKSMEKYSRGKEKCCNDQTLEVSDHGKKKSFQ